MYLLFTTQKHSKILKTESIPSLKACRIPKGQQAGSYLEAQHELGISALDCTEKRNHLEQTPFTALGAPLEREVLHSCRESHLRKL